MNVEEIAEHNSNLESNHKGQNLSSDNSKVNIIDQSQTICSSSTYVKREEILEKSLIKNDDANNQMTHASNDLNIFNIKSNINEVLPPVSKHQGKSILENFLTRPFSSVYQGGSHYNNMDNRKVEPLKINLNREPIKTVIKIPQVNNSEQQHSPKIIIKPIKPPSSEQTNYDVESDQRLIKSHSNAVSECNDYVNTSFEPNVETHIVPKLTIRNISHSTPTSVLSSTSSVECTSSSNTESFHTVVPKLTIKIDHQNSQEFTQSKIHEKKSRHEEGMLTASGVKLTIKPIPEPPIPKLTIKTSTSNTDHPDNHSSQSHSIPKLLIKSTHPECLKVDESSELSDENSNEDNEEKFNDAQHSLIPKITLKNNTIDQTDTTQTVPKLILKMGGSKIICKDDISNMISSSTEVEENYDLESKINSPNPDLVSSELTDSKMDVSYENNITETLSESSETNLHQHNNSVIVTKNDNPDSPRIILKINKSNTSDTKTTVKCSSLVINDSNIESNSNFNEPDTNSATSVQPSSPIILKTFKNDTVSQHKSIKRGNNQYIEQDQEGSLKKIKLDSQNSETLDPSTLDCSIKLDNDGTDKAVPILSDFCANPEKTDDLQEDIFDNYSKPEIETVCITIDDDSSSVERQKNEEDIMEDINKSTENINNSEELLETTPVKRGRGRPKKVMETIKSPKESELSEKDITNFSEIAATDVLGQKKTNENRKTPTRGRPRGRGRGGKTVEIVKDGKVLQVKMDAGFEQDDSPTFSIYNRYASTRGKGRGGRGKRGSLGKVRKSLSNENAQSSFDSNKSQTISMTDLKVSLQKLPVKLNNCKSSLQIFEEDTMMGGDVIQTPYKTLPEFLDESQSSQLSSASATNEGRERKRGKMEVCEPEGRTEFTVDMLAEYDWPQKHGQKQRSSETYMIQEQISEYLGIKSFKRKYPDLMRRPVEMEERNFMMERGLVSEKMCDLGLTAVIASEILDIMCNDYPEKYEEYRRYQREKQFLEFSHRQKLLRFEQENKGQLQKDKAIETAASWNAILNKERFQSRKSCIDLQTLIIHIPKSKSEQITAKNEPRLEKTNYPISLVPGQFSEFYKPYSAEELACYPVNTVLIHHSKLDALLKKREKILNDYSGSESDVSEDIEEDHASSSSDSYDSCDSSSSDEEDNEVFDPLCAVCELTQYKNSYGHPEIFIECSACHRKAHPTCIKMPTKMVKRAMEYNWKCAECKNCSKCMRTTDESKMLFCGQCDRGYHIYCLGLRNVPEGQWYCNICTICTKCGTKNPEGNPNPLLTPNQRQNLAMIANWTHVYRTNNITKLREHYQTLCVPCSKLKTI